MPELPEVETVRRALSSMVSSRKIESVSVCYPRIIAPTDDCADATMFAQSLAGMVIEDVHRRGKFLLFILSNGILLSHLRMEGCYYLSPTDAPREKHEHVIFHLDGEDLRYRDVRKFGRMMLFLKSEEEVLSLLPLSHLGFEPLDLDANGETLREALHASKKPIKEVLLDQTKIAGIGNIYASEALFHAHILPLRPASSLSEAECARLMNEIKETLSLAIASGGSTIRTFRSPTDAHGAFQEHFAVYHKETCPLCGGAIKRITLGGRSTFYCPHCQK